ncbi:MAG: UvrD-helicase domain-containing protein, partial [Thermodesulfobacteriota bacterium]|nr:UvrD-helicase domain-containing protein [Thermodesulfobacteriota bacterium]
MPELLIISAKVERLSRSVRSVGSLRFKENNLRGGVFMKEIQLNPQQQEAVSHGDGPMIVLSVAGSGKTMVLTERIIHLIEDGIDPARLLAITFAKKAVQEIQSRLEKRLNSNGDKTLVCTFHSLGYRILKAETLFWSGFRLIHDG